MKKNTVNKITTTFICYSLRQTPNLTAYLP